MSDPPKKTDLAGAPRTRRYEFRERIGEGAMGIVFRAHDRETGLEVALKTLLLDVQRGATWARRSGS